ncbi:MAG: hypothetical protein ACE37F_08515 [Nannocystaceae bacterium]|nr:hypothetical protein [bacterium]
MSHLFRASILTGVLLAGGCKSTDEPTVSPDVSVTDSPAGDASKREGDDRPEFAGVAHSGNIAQVVLDPTGTAALSRDAVGGVRLWPSLDGSLEPQSVPIANPQSMAVLTAGEGFVVLGVEASGGARVVAMQADGHAKDLRSLPPFNPVQQVVSIRGGRFAALMRDGSIHVFDITGDEIATFDDKGFQPTSIRPSADGKHLVALTKQSRAGTGIRVSAQRLSFAGNGESLGLERSGTPRVLELTPDVTETSVVISPDASEAAVLARGVTDHWDVELYSFEADEPPRKVEVRFGVHQQPHLGYAGPSRLLISSNEGTPSKLIDTKSQSVRLRTSIPQDFNHQGRAQDIVAGRQVVGYGTFLFVHDVEDRQHRFLGYRATQGSSVGVSPSGAYVAWAYTQGPVVVEALDGSVTPAEIDFGSNNFAGVRVRFLDDDHIVIVDAVGEISLVHWRSGEVIARAGTMSNVRAVHLDPAQGIFVLERYSNEAWVYEVSPEKGFEGPYIVGDTYRLGILRPQPPSDVVLWTLQAANNKIRQFTLEQLRADLTVAETEALGVSLEAGRSAPLAVDPLGRHYGVHWNGSGLEMFVRHGEQTLGSRSMQTNDINQILPSPQGDRFLAVLNRSGSVSVSMHETATLEPLWSYSTGVFNNDTAWSDDGRFVAFSANTGAILLDVATGEPVLSRCGLRFTALGAPPNTAFSSPNQKSICEP